MNLFNNCTKPIDDIGRRYLHSLKRGDHVVRWTRIVVYPIQVHGIVLSASDDAVTIVDFGLTASSSSLFSSEEGKSKKEENKAAVASESSNNSPLEEMTKLSIK